MQKIESIDNKFEFLINNIIMKIKSPKSSEYTFLISWKPENLRLIIWPKQLNSKLFQVDLLI